MRDEVPERKEHEVLNINMDELNRVELKELGVELCSEVADLQELKAAQLTKLALVTVLDEESEALWSDYVTTDDRLNEVEDALSEADGIYAANFIY